MARSRRNSRSWLHIADDVQVEMLGKVAERVVIGHDLAASKRRHLRIPLLFRSAQAPVKVLKSLLKIGCVGRVQLAELPRNSTRYPSPVIRIKPVVGISQRMHVT